MSGVWCRVRGVWLAVVLLALVGCSSVKVNRAPVEDRGTASRPVAAPPAAAAQQVKPLPGIENAGKPGYYTVKPGDTLMRIGLDTGQNHKDISRWNNLENPNRIEVGQVLRVAPPAPEAAAVAKPVSAGSAVAAPLPNGAQAAPAAKAASAPGAAPSPAPAAASSAPVAGGQDDELPWMWPVSGNILAAFDESKNNGIDLGGAAGDPVVAAADGRVIWAGLGEGSMRNYGNLIIIQHNKTYITAYANNQTLLVKEDQRVKKGQKIAEMGSSGTDRVKLHFELRRMGKAQDPTKYLPAR